MLIEMYKQVMIMSVFAGILYLFLKVSSILTQRYFTATWHYYSYLLICSMFIIPFYKLITLFDLNFTSGKSEVESESFVGVAESVSQIANIPAFFNVENQPSSLSLVSSIVAGYLPYILMSGTLIYLGVVLLQSYRLNRLISTLCELTMDIQVLGILSECKKKLNITKEISVYISPFITSPFLYGVFRPKVIMPSLDFKKEEYQHVLMHELTHYKRRDVWVKYFLIVINSLHWFNPLAYMIRRDIDKYCEMSCDENIVILMNTNERRQYCKLLLNVLWHAADQKTKLYSAFTDKQSNIERRVNMIMRTDGIRRKRWIRMTAILVTLSFAIVGSIVAYAANESSTKAAESVVEHHINPIYSDKEILYYLFWTEDKELKNDLINLQSELELTDEQMSQLKDLGLKEHQATQELVKQDISSEEFNAAVSNVFSKRNDSLKELLQEKFSTFEGWILSWWIKEKDRRTGSKSASNESNISEHKKISQSDFTRILKIIQDVNAGKLPESALEEAQPLLEARPYFRTAR